MNNILYEYGACLGFQTITVYYHSTSLSPWQLLLCPLGVSHCMDDSVRDRGRQGGPVKIHMRLGPSVPFESYGRWWQS